MAKPPSLETYLDLIPEECRHRLDHKIAKNDSRARIARSITNWQIVANFLPGIDDHDITAIKNDQSLAFELQKIELLKKWKERNGHCATYRQLAQSLFDAGAIDSVHILCQELGTPHNPPRHSTPSQPTQHTFQQPLPAPIGGSAACHPDSTRAREIVEQAARLQDRFVTVVLHTNICCVKKEAESGVFLMEFRRMVKTLPLSKRYQQLHFLEEEKDHIKMAKDVEEILDILERYWNYKDYAFLERIIKEVGSCELQKEMREYIAELEEFERKTSVKDYNSAALDKVQIPPNFEKHAITQLKDPAECSLYEVRQLKNEIVNRSTLTGYSIFWDVQCSSVVIVLAFPPKAYTELLESLDEQFMKAHQLQGGEDKTSQQKGTKRKVLRRLNLPRRMLDLESMIFDEHFVEKTKLLNVQVSAPSYIHEEAHPSIGRQLQPENEATFVTASSTAPFVSAFDPSATFGIIAQLQVQFVTIVTHTKICLMKKQEESKAFFLAFLILLTTMPVLVQARYEDQYIHFLEEEKHRIKMAKDVKKVLDILEPYWNYVDYDFLEHIIKEFGTSELQKEMKEYIEKLEQFEKSTCILECNFGDLWLPKRKIPAHFSTLTAVLSWNHAEYSLYQVRKFKNEMADYLNINKYAVYLKSVRPGSVVIKLAIPPVRSI